MNKLILKITMYVCLARGAFVFDMGGSAKGTNTTASALCLIAAVFAAGFLYRDEQKDIETQDKARSKDL